jgi:hypothetical protein
MAVVRNLETIRNESEKNGILHDSQLGTKLVNLYYILLATSVRTGPFSFALSIVVKLLGGFNSFPVLSKHTLCSSITICLQCLSVWLLEALGRSMRSILLLRFVL